MTSNTEAAGGSADPALRAVIGQRMLIADGAMGSMLQGSPATLDDFCGHEGCNEILNVTRPDIVAEIHDGYLAAGVDCVTTNTFGANLGNLGEYGIADRILELAAAGARLARQAADRWSDDSRRRWVLGWRLCLADLFRPRAQGQLDVVAGRIGVTLSEEFQLAPEQSTDALIAHHPEAKYFST